MLSSFIFHLSSSADAVSSLFQRSVHSILSKIIIFAKNTTNFANKFFNTKPNKQAYETQILTFDIADGADKPAGIGTVLGKRDDEDKQLLQLHFGQNDPFEN